MLNLKLAAGAAVRQSEGNSAANREVIVMERDYFDDGSQKLAPFPVREVRQIGRSLRAVVRDRLRDFSRRRGGNL